MTEIKRITTQAELVRLANRLRLRVDWHEPDEQQVTAAAFGTVFDNAGFWGADASFDGQSLPPEQDHQGMEMWVVLYHDGTPVAEVNLAMLFAFAAGFPG
jgi:hypothetical protein